MFDTPIARRLDSRKLCDAEQLINGYIEVAELDGRSVVVRVDAW